MTDPGRISSDGAACGDHLIDRRTILRLAAVTAGAAGLARHTALAAPIAGPATSFQRHQEGENPFGEPTTTGGAYVLMSSGSGYPHVFIPVAYYGTTGFFVCKLLYTPLIHLDSEWNEMIPAIAESWSWSEDGLQLTVNLRSDITFHDGQPVTARDVEFTYKLMVRKEAFPAVQDVTIFEGGAAFRDRETEEFAGVTVIDDQTVRFNLNAPSNVFLLNITNIGILPSHLFDDEALTSDGFTQDVPFFTDHPIGSGPFKLKDFDLESYVTLERNESYFKGAPILDEFTIRFRVAPAAQIAAIESGEADGMFTTSPQDAQVLSTNDQLAFTLTTAIGNVQLLTVSTEKEYLPVPVRQALLHAIDVETLIATVGYGFPAPAPSVMMWAQLFPNEALPAYPFDQERARQLLTEAGWDDSRTLRFGGFSQQGVPDNVIAAIMNMWEAAGVRVEFVPLDPADSVALSQAEDHIFDFVYDTLAWQAYDPSSSYGFFACGQPGNYSHYCNEEFDAAMSEAMRTVDADEARRLYQEAQVILQTDLPVLPIWLGPDFWAVNRRMHGGILGRGPINDVKSELWWKE